VELVSADPLHVPQWGTAVRSEVGVDGALVHIATDVRNSASAPSPLGTLRQSLIGPDGKVAAKLPDVALDFAPGEQRTKRTTGSRLEPCGCRERCHGL
jgi:beta-galactosidase